MEYSAEVRQRFSAPTRAGQLAPAVGTVVEGVAEDRSLSVWFRFQVQLQDVTIERVRFRAYGCPHTIAAADRVAEALEGQSRDELANVDLQALALAIELPREKFGKLLCLEDALADCRRQAARLE